jgi:transcriptional regulator with XRE-family HTH domain
VKNREKLSTGWGARIRRIRDEKGLTQAEFGRLLGGYRWHQIRDLESEKTKPSAAFLIELSQRLGILGEWLLDGKGPMYARDLQLLVRKRNPEGKVNEPAAGYILPPELTGKQRRQIIRLIKELSKLKEGDREKAIKVIKTIFPK